MAPAPKANILFWSFLVLQMLLQSSSASPRKLVLVPTPSPKLNYHNGPLLKGNYTLHPFFYGQFSPSQIAVVSDFLRSLSAPSSVATWWATTSKYNTGPTSLSLGHVTHDVTYSRGKSLNTSDVKNLLAENAIAADPTSISLLLTSADVAVEGFCSSRCGTHQSLSKSRTCIWVGNPAVQCPGQCAWPFHQPIYGPQTPPLVSPNNDVGIDGMIITLATALAGTVTNPFGSGFYQGPASAPLEAVSACAGMFGPGSYPGYPGRVRIESSTGASYNAVGLDGRKYLLPAMWDPETSQCATL